MESDNCLTQNLAYLLDGKVYVNLTNQCTNDCVFCIRTLKDSVVDKNLWLSSENIDSSDVVEQLEKILSKSGFKAKEVVFCGYGEPLIKLDLLKQVASYIREKYPKFVIRINTNGHADKIHSKDVAKELTGLVDEISISLNAGNEKLYNELSNPKIKDAYNSMKTFAQSCVKNGIKTTLSVVVGYKNYEIDEAECERLAKEIGAGLRKRVWLDNGY